MKRSFEMPLRSSQRTIQATTKVRVHRKTE
jgi:hypothetical protein